MPIVLAQIVPFSFGEDEFNLDDMVSTMCTVTKGDLPLEIEWFFMDVNNDTKKLFTNDGIVITRTNQRMSILSIEAVKARHRGTYLCRVKNRGGETSHSTVLAINGT
jgi:hypothetical protein